MNLDRETLLTCRLFQVQQISYIGPNQQRHIRQVIHHPGSVAIVPIVDATHVCLIRNYRCAIDQTLIELPAGTREQGETAEVTAARELMEETGFRAHSLRSIGSFYPAPGILDEQMTLFVASGLQSGIARRQPGEQIENLIVSWSDALGMVRDRTICDAKTMLGLLLAAPAEEPGEPQRH